MLLLLFLEIYQAWSEHTDEGGVGFGMGERGIGWGGMGHLKAHTGFVVFVFFGFFFDRGIFGMFCA